MLGATMSENIFFKSIRVPYSVFTGLLLSVLLSSCTGGVKNDYSSAIKGDSSLKIEGKSVPNNAVIYILTPDGRVNDSIYYQRDYDSFKYANYIKGYPISDTIIGDFNGDGVKETGIIKYIEYYDNEGSINLEANQCVIEFSVESINPLIIETCTEAIAKNEGDLNEDGKDEIGLLPGWVSSGCRQYQVYTFRTNKWVQISDPIENSYNMREAGIVLIEKDRKKGFAVIRQSVDSYMFESDPENKIPFKYYQGSCCAWSNAVERTIKLR